MKHMCKRPEQQICPCDKDTPGVTAGQQPRLVQCQAPDVKAETGERWPAAERGRLSPQTAALAPAEAGAHSLPSQSEPHVPVTQLLNQIYLLIQQHADSKRMQAVDNLEAAQCIASLRRFCVLSVSCFGQFHLIW